MIHRYSAVVAEQNYEISVEVLDGDQYRVSIDGKARVVAARRVTPSGSPGLWSLLPPEGGAARLVDVDGHAPDYVVAAEGQSIPVKLEEGRRAALIGLAQRPAATGPQPVRSPMPGKVVKLHVKVGDVVRAQQGVVVVEAMKMENELKAPRDGTVESVVVSEGQAVESGQVLLTIA